MSDEFSAIVNKTLAMLIKFYGKPENLFQNSYESSHQAVNFYQQKDKKRGDGGIGPVDNSKSKPCFKTRYSAYNVALRYLLAMYLTGYQAARKPIRSTIPVMSKIFSVCTATG